MVGDLKSKRDPQGLGWKQYAGKGQLALGLEDFDERLIQLLIAAKTRPNGGVPKTSIDVKMTGNATRPPYSNPDPHQLGGIGRRRSPRLVNGS